MWTLINLYEPPYDIETTELIPNGWLINNKYCWYPISFRLSTIKSLAKSETSPNFDLWDKCKIDILENNIDNYEYGLKIMHRAAKNKPLHSECEQDKGRGKRIKKKSTFLELGKHSSTPSNSDQDDDSNDFDQQSKKRKKLDQNELLQSLEEYPPFPINQQIASTSNDDQPSKKQTLIEIEDFSEILGSIMNKSTTEKNDNEKLQNDDELFATEKLISFDCKLLPKKNNRGHSCFFEHISDTNDTNALIVALGHTICMISSDIEKLKKNSFFMKKELESYMVELLDSRARDDGKNNSFISNKCQEDNILSSFPFKNENDLNMMENQLKSEDLHFTNKLISAFVFASEGKTISKVTNNLLKTIFTNELASMYSWKGQKNKKKLEDLHISKVIIAAVRKKFDNIHNCKQETISSIMSWMAQAPTRIQRSNSTKSNTADPNNTANADD
ncbi:uncharacterized protein LOC107882504 isoform X1 [Acyrthosiphon pisum]|uniref:DUF4806 domain-containing protein n=1 Tax=Acyrthosiphon pisum TaxID=7029 RepID=A0A8R2H5G1_ACYPI|nr:uncharacterized protein LOC107882504 isoform X1 [Acyrthosiphon pisum]|eukprot:XP_016656395.1 PREDICTED: uncharacterized protein LOC107882504 [Acyrthosiphon pisum]